MKIFAIYLKVILTKKPTWFEEFCAKFMGTSILHVTLVQPRHVTENQVSDIKSKISEVLKAHIFDSENKKLIFDTLVKDRESDGTYTFMLMARKNDLLINLQKNLVESLENYENYFDNKNKEYEINFKPHLTIGVNISENVKKEVQKYFSSDYTCEGEITVLVLPVVKDRSVEEADNPKNLVIFNL